MGGPVAIEPQILVMAKWGCCIVSVRYGEAVGTRNLSRVLESPDSFFGGDLCRWIRYIQGGFVALPGGHLRMDLVPALIIVRVRCSCIGVAASRC